MLTYEPVSLEDLESVYQLNKRLIDQYEDLSSIDYPQVLRWVRRNIQKNLPNFVRVRKDGILAGYYCLCTTEGKTELDSLFVLPPFQEQGIGTEILKRCLKESATPIFLFVFRKNTRALSLYQRMGFRIVAEAGATRYIMENDPRR